MSANGKLVEIKLVDLGETLRAANALRSDIAPAFAGGVYLWVCDAIRAAMRLAPVATGWLRQSRYVTKPLDFGFEGAFTITAGFSASYAWFVENVPANHRTGQDSFMYDGFQSQIPGAATRITSVAMRLLKSSTGINSLSPQQPTAPFNGPLTNLDARRRKQEKVRKQRQMRHTREHARAGERQE